MPAGSRREIKVNEALTEAEIADCWPVIHQLRPHVPQDELVGRILQQQKDEGYHLMYIQNEDDRAVAICGFRILNFLWSGKTLYVDDLCTHSSTHRMGYAGRLLEWIEQHAIEHNCDAIALDSGYTRNTAHRLYLNKGFVLESHHFYKNLKTG